MEYEEILEAVQALPNDKLKSLLYSIGVTAELEPSEKNVPEAEEPVDNSEELPQIDINKLEDTVQKLAEENAGLRSDISKLIDSGAFFNAQNKEPHVKTEQEQTLDALFS